MRCVYWGCSGVGGPQRIGARDSPSEAGRRGPVPWARRTVGRGCGERPEGNGQRCPDGLCAWSMAFVCVLWGLVPGAMEVRICCGGSPPPPPHRGGGLEKKGLRLSLPLHTPVSRAPRGPRPAALVDCGTEPPEGRRTVSRIVRHRAGSAPPPPPPPSPLPLCRLGCDVPGPSRAVCSPERPLRRGAVPRHAPPPLVRTSGGCTRTVSMARGPTSPSTTA